MKGLFTTKMKPTKSWREVQQKEVLQLLIQMHISVDPSLFLVTIYMKETRADGQELVRTEKIKLVDLAGNENTLI